jgi:hypothetical protein
MVFSPIIGQQGGAVSFCQKSFSKKKKELVGCEHSILYNKKLLGTIDTMAK